MGKWLLTLVLVLAAAAAAVYFWLFRPREQALAACQQEVVAGIQECSALRRQVADLTSIRDQLQKTSAELQQQVQEKEKELASLHSTQDELVGQLKQEITDKQVQIEQVRDQLRVDLVDEILFDSGEASLKPAGIAVIRKVGAVIKKAENRR